MARYWIISCSERTSTRSNPRASGVGRPTLELQYAHPLHGDALPPVRDAPVEARKLSIRSMLEPGKGPYRRKPARLASGFMRAHARRIVVNAATGCGVEPSRGRAPRCRVGGGANAFAPKRCRAANGKAGGGPRLAPRGRAPAVVLAQGSADPYSPSVACEVILMAGLGSPAYTMRCGVE
jgi:hypothetical protein